MKTRGQTVTLWPWSCGDTARVWGSPSIEIRDSPLGHWSIYFFGRATKNLKMKPFSFVYISPSANNAAY
jgi:hypothetical protein